ncbi:MAG TPA: hypothetical protein P5205_21945 [Candidatus Paceibacterota bacterium]|nr:hypothetical protein [Verrucomicrobiota bacterium]HSA13025.1 hypothetical protein [Candidatus Paceibacterota bacterium]
MRLLLAIGVWAALAAGFAARGETWTNLAGKVIAAKLVGVQSEQVLLQRPNGHILRLPLSSLKPEDRIRAREQSGTERLPAELKTPLEQAKTDIQRAAQFLQGGKITREEYAARCEKVKQRFEHLARQALKDRGEAPDDQVVKRLKQQLDRVAAPGP